MACNELQCNVCMHLHPSMINKKISRSGTPWITIRVRQIHNLVNERKDVRPKSTIVPEDLNQETFSMRSKSTNFQFSTSWFLVQVFQVFIQRLFHEITIIELFHALKSTHFHTSYIFHKSHFVPEDLWWDVTPNTSKEDFPY